MTISDRAASVERLSACPLCGGQSLKGLPVPGHWIGGAVFQDLQGRLGLVQCRACGLVFTNPRPSSEKLTEFYPGDTYTCHEASGSASAGAKADYLLEWIARYLPADAPRSLLDYGAGGGGFLAHARARGWEVRGFEPGRRGLESCRRAGLKVTDRVEDLPQHEFGLVTLHHVFEHLANPADVLNRVRRLLAPQGRLFIEVPNARSLRARLALPFFSHRFRINERYRAYPIHLMYYSDRTLRETLKRAKWKVEKTFTIGIGLEEFFLEAESSRKQSTQASGADPAGPRKKRRLRHRLRDAFLGLGVGENLAAIAYPAHSGD